MNQTKAIGELNGIVTELLKCDQDELAIVLGLVSTAIQHSKTSELRIKLYELMPGLDVREPISVLMQNSIRVN